MYISLSLPQCILGLHLIDEIYVYIPVGTGKQLLWSILH